MASITATPDPDHFVRVEHGGAVAVIDQDGPWVDIIDALTDLGMDDESAERIAARIAL